MDLLKTERFQDAPQRQTHGEAPSYTEQKCNIDHKKLFLNNSEVVPRWFSECQTPHAFLIQI